jgi:hypothetical protein
MKDRLQQTLKQNLARVESLVQTYESHPDAKGRGRKSAELLDILRAAVVLLHASLEDMLRGVAAWKLPAADKAVLDEIPLAGVGANPRKVLLGDLSQHRTKRIDEVIAESIDGYLQRSNYNNPGEVAELLQNVHVDTAKVNGRFTGLGTMMERRHQIVHRADRQQKVKGSGDHTVRAINKYQVRAWLEDVRVFATDLFAQL